VSCCGRSEQLKIIFITVPVFCTSWNLISTTSSSLRATRHFENAALLREKKNQSTSRNQYSVQLRCRDPVMVGFEHISQRTLYIYLQNGCHAENWLNYARRQASLNIIFLTAEFKTLGLTWNCRQAIHQ